MNSAPSFISQIQEDILGYQSKFSYVPNMNKPEWAFNFWVLDKLYSVDEDLIEGLIIDYNDLGVDCYVWHEDTKDLYLIQNKYYSENSDLSLNYVRNNFLVSAIGALENGTYSHSLELQTIFNKYKDDEDFTVYLSLYITNNASKKKSLEDAIAEFNESHSDQNYIARIFWLDEIKELYYDLPLEEKKGLTFNIESKNKGTILNIDSKEYGLKQKIDARYVFTPILNLYQLCKESKSSGYPLFDSNIREYLGSRVAVNKGIRKTLLDDDDRHNFFYYNNGITMIVKDMGSIETGQPTTIRITNPQIVNGCQTVSTIYETLSELPEDAIQSKFADTYVMIKILKIPKQTAEFKQLSQNIVRFNNSQNSIDSKTFESLSSEFVRIQTEFKRKGFLVCLKQSDNHKFTEEYKNSASPLLKECQPLLIKFGIGDIKRAADLMINLEKLLQIFISFTDAHDAVQNKSKLLQGNSQQNKNALAFITDSEITTNDQVLLLLLFMRLEKERKKGNIFNPFFLINCFGKYECSGNAHNISNLLKDVSDVDQVVEHYLMVLSMYASLWMNANPGKGYNEMIKAPIDFKTMDTCKNVVSSTKPLNLNGFVQ